MWRMCSFMVIFKKLYICTNHLDYETVNFPNMSVIFNARYMASNSPPSLRSWYHRFDQHALTIGLQHSRTNSSLFIIHTYKVTTYVLLYVYDIILIAPSVGLLHQITTKLSHKFVMTDFGPPNYFICIFVVWSSTYIFLSRQKYNINNNHHHHLSKTIATS